MKSKFRNNEKGAISLFVVIAMMFFLVFVLGSYMMVARRNQQQVEALVDLQAVYKKDGEKEYEKLVSPINDIIYIKDSSEYFYMGTGKLIGGIEAKMDSKYMLANDIEIDLKEIANFNDASIEKPFKFQDYLMYNENDDLFFDKNGHDVYYMYNGKRYKLLIYDLNTTNTLISDNKTTGTATSFSMYNDASQYSDLPHEFLLYKERESINKFDSIVGVHKDKILYRTIINTDTIPELKDLSCMKNLKVNDKYFLFIKADKNNSIAGNKLENIVSVGDYIDYKLNYQDLLGINEKDVTTYGWRVIGVYEGTVKLVAEGAPITYTNSATTNGIYATLTDDFKNTTFKSKVGNKLVNGRYFMNAYATNVIALNYGAVSYAVTDIISKDYITEVGGITNTSLKDGYPTYTAGWKDKKTGLFEVDTKYWIPMLGKAYYINGEDSNYRIEEASVNGGEEYAIRPLITLKDNLMIISDEDGNTGDGTKNNPYKIGFIEEKKTEPIPGQYVKYVDENGTEYDYINVSINEKSTLEKGWRILEYDTDGIKLISGGIPFSYNIYSKSVDTIVNDLSTNFENTSFTELYNDYGYNYKQTQYGSKFKRSDYVDKVRAFTYEDFSKLVYGHEDYMAVSLNRDYNVTYNTIDEESEFFINEWTEEKKNLINLDSDYILNVKTGETSIIYARSTGDENYLAKAIAYNDVGVRVVVELNKDVKIVSGTGTEVDPYILGK